MTLREAIRSHQGEVVKIGAFACFIYCDLCDETTEDFIEELDDTEKKQVREAARRTRAYLKDFNKIWESRIALKLAKIEERRKDVKKSLERLDLDESRIRLSDIPRAEKQEKLKEIFSARRQLKVERIETRERVLRDLAKEKEKDYKRAVLSAEKAALKKEQYRPLITRTVREIYKGIYGETIILIEGTEVGSYWTVKGFRKGKDE